MSTLPILAFVWPSFALGAELGNASSASQGVDSEQQSVRTATRYELSLLGEYGFGGKYEDSPANRFGAGYGFRAGLTLPSVPLFLGLHFTKFFGGTDGMDKYSTNTLDGELGYSIDVVRDVAWLRPQVGLGVAQMVSDQPDNVGSSFALHVAPGLIAGVRLRSLLLTAGVQQDLVPGQWSSATTLSLGAGLVF